MTQERSIDRTWTTSLSDKFGECRGNCVARNAVTSNNVNAAARDVTRMRTYHDTFGVSLKPAKNVTNQRHSGRCWMFATMNVARAKTIELLDVEEFEFSQVFGMFYDKLEKSNTFLCNIIDTIDAPVDSREVSFLMDEPIGDGGEFRFAANLIDKYGLVPLDAMPETACSKDSAQMNTQLSRALRRGAMELRHAHEAGATAEKLDAMRLEILADIHSILSVCLGEPPATIDFECEVGSCCRYDQGALIDMDPSHDNDGKPRRMVKATGITPIEFRNRFVGFKGSDYVELVSMAGDSRPYNTLMGIRMIDSVQGGAPYRFLNVEPSVVEQAAIASLKNGVPCYMACDVMQSFGRTLEDFPGVLALDGMDYESLFGVELDMSESDMYDSRESAYTHAMTFQGVQLAEHDEPVAWRIENSWGKDSCKDGYLVASAEWYRLYGGAVAVERRFVSPEVLEACDTQKPKMYDPWSPVWSACHSD